MAAASKLATKLARHRIDLQRRGRSRRRETARLPTTQAMLSGRRGPLYPCLGGNLQGPGFRLQ